MAAHPLSYFTATLGEAAVWNEKHPHRVRTINGLLDLLGRQESSTVDCLAVGFPYPDGSVTTFTFGQLNGLSAAAADVVASLLPVKEIDGSEEGGQQKGTIGLLSRSSPDFLFAWLGAMRLGYAVLLLAPQLEPAAVAHLCKACGVTVILHDEANAPMLGRDDMMQQLTHSLNITHAFAHLSPSPNPAPHQPSSATNPSSTAYLFHTSGTSSGRPKPIPQSHNGSISALPLLPAAHPPAATFTTTPLYHGGLPDCLRAWMGRSPVWLFAEGTMPITARTAKHKPQPRTPRRRRREVAYFSSVPYVLQLLADDPPAVQRLRALRTVGVGGAALAPAVGDALVRAGVRLVSRYGSAECGFLLSSARDFGRDAGWRWLRASSPAAVRYLAFETRTEDDGLVELIVRDGWPLVARRNREDGGYATADLFEVVDGEDGVVRWRYHSRDDAQIVLDSGKKFDPAPVEADAVAGAGGGLADVLVFGTGKQFPGALLFVTAPPDSQPNAEASQAVIHDVWPVIDRINKGSQGHARLDKGMLRVVWVGPDEPLLPKSSKGTVMRRQAEARYQGEMDAAYSSYMMDMRCQSGAYRQARDLCWSRDEVHATMRDVFRQVLGWDTVRWDRLRSDQDLFLHGVDSVAATKIRGLLNATFFGDSANTSFRLPMSVVYEQGSMDKIADLIFARLGGDMSLANEEGVDEEAMVRKEMIDLAQKYSTFDSLRDDTESTQLPRRVHHDADGSDPVGEIVLLTGATGLLGGHILDCLCRTKGVRKIFCLVRAGDVGSAYRRVSESQAMRGLPPLHSYPSKREGPLADVGTSPGPDADADAEASIVVCLPWPTTSFKETMGGSTATDVLPPGVRPTLVVHAAWPVNFTLRLAQFEAHVAAVRGLAVLARRTGARMVFVSSTAAVSEAGGTRPVPEEVLAREEPEVASPVGYGRSKWVAEQVCDAAARSACLSGAEGENWKGGRGAVDGQEGARVDIVRVGQLCGNAQGVWNMSEAFPLILSTAKLTGCLPDLPEQRIDWLAVDVAAEAICEIALSESAGAREGAATRDRGSDVKGARVYHLLAQASGGPKAPSWRTMLGWIASSAARTDDDDKDAGAAGFATVSAAGWLGRLEEACKETDHPASALLAFWRKAYGDANGAEGGRGLGHEDVDADLQTSTAPRFAMAEMAAVSPAFRDATFPDERAVLRMWAWVTAQEECRAGRSSSL